MASSSSALSPLSLMLPSSPLSPHQPISSTRVSFLRSASPPPLRLGPCLRSKFPPLSFAISSAAGNNDDNGNDNIGGRGGGGGGGGGDGGDGGSSGGNHGEALIVPAQVRRELESLLADAKAAAEGGHVEGELLADDLFVAKLAMECGVGAFSKTAAEYEKRRDNFFKEINIVISDVVMAVVADFMLISLSAPTVSLQPSHGRNSRFIASLCHNCPDFISQVAVGTRAYCFVDRLKTIVVIGPKLFALPTSASLVDPSVADALVIARKAVVEELHEKVEEIPAVSTPDEDEEKNWWSCFEAQAELSAGLVLPRSSMRGGWFHPAALGKVSAFLSRGSCGRSGKNGTA